MEDKLPFKVLEFNGEARRITLSHTRTFEEGDEPIETTQQTLAPVRQAPRAALPMVARA
jgi:small subunit ribosomal protein S1